MQKYFSGIFLLLILSLHIQANAEVLPLRSQISLNGTWNFTPEGQPTSTIQVPDFWDAQIQFKDVKHAVYERK